MKPTIMSFEIPCCLSCASRSVLAKPFCAQCSSAMFAQRFEAVFLVIELFGVALQEEFFVGAAFERFHVFAEALLVVEDLLGFFFSGGFLCFYAFDDSFLREDFS